MYFAVLDRVPTLVEDVGSGGDVGFLLPGPPEDPRVELVPAEPADETATVTADDMATHDQVQGSQRFLGTEESDW